MKVLSYSVSISFEIFKGLLDNLVNRSSILVFIRNVVTSTLHSDRLGYYLFRYCLGPSFMPSQPVVTPEDISGRKGRHMCMAMSNMIRLLGILDGVDLKKAVHKLRDIMTGSFLDFSEGDEIDTELIIGGLLFNYGLNRYYGKTGSRTRVEQFEAPPMSQGVKRSSSEEEPEEHHHC